MTITRIVGNTDDVAKFDLETHFIMLLVQSFKEYSRLEGSLLLFSLDLTIQTDPFLRLATVSWWLWLKSSDVD